MVVAMVLKKGYIYDSLLSKSFLQCDINWFLYILYAGRILVVEIGFKKVYKEILGAQVWHGAVAIIYNALLTSSGTMQYLLFCINTLTVMKKGLYI